MVLGLLCLPVAVRGQNSTPAENVDHAGIISRWDEQSLERGRKTFLVACAPCHGNNGVQTINPQARPFAVAKFQNGNDPHSLFNTITRGYKNMPSQTWMTPEQRYEVVQYIRETFVKKLNPSQYFEVDSTYLNSLPKFDSSLKQVSAMDHHADFGPVLESQLGTHFADVLTVQLKDGVSLSYDLLHMRLAGAWLGGFLDLSRTGHAQQRGEGQPLPGGKPLPGLQQWSWAFNGKFDYPAENLLPRGPLPPDWMKYHGHYVYDRKAVLSYAIEGRDVLELPEAEKAGDMLVVTHSLRIEAGSKNLKLCVGQLNSPGDMVAGLVSAGQTVPVGKLGPVEANLVMAGQAGSANQGFGDYVVAGARGATQGLSWEADDQGRLVLNIPADHHPRIVQIICSSVNGPAAFRQFDEYFRKAGQESPVDPKSVTTGGARLWPLTIHVKGQLGKSDAAYALDTIPVPFDNPYGAWLRTSAVAFFPDGRAVVTTYGGDVWIVSGLDHDLPDVTWSRFATGLYEPFGVQVVKGLIYVTCRNGIVRLKDINSNGEADFYETWYADTDISTFFHSYNFDLQVDHRGHFYYVKAGEYTDYKLPGAVLEISPDGGKASVYCTGFRVPNGMGMLPDESLTVSDNQGDWMPAGKVNIVHRGGFYGYVQNLTGGGGFGDHWSPDGGRVDTSKVVAPKTFDQPIIWVPQEFDNSSAAQLFVNDPRFGPLSGRLLHTSFGKGWMYYLMTHEVGAVSQAAIVALPFHFDAGLMRARVNPADGQVYATGLSGWQGPDGGRDGCLQRLRYTGKSIRMLDDVQVHPDGLSLRFNFSLDPKSAMNPDSYHLEQWNYHWTSHYGSEQYSLEHPERKGHDRLTIQSVALSKDGREVKLAISGLRPVNQIELRLNLKSADGADWKELSYMTINAIPDR